jgi:hypothetical protein
MPEQERHDKPEGRPKGEKEQQEITELLNVSTLKLVRSFFSQVT